MKRMNKIGKTFNFHFVNEFNLPHFNLNNVDVSFTLHFFKYTSNHIFYKKDLELLKIIAENI